MAKGGSRVAGTRQTKVVSQSKVGTQVAGAGQTKVGSQKKVRLQLEMTGERERELTELMERVEVATKKDFLNNALTLLEWAIEEVQVGRVIASLDEAEMKYKVVVMPILENVRRRSRVKIALDERGPSQLDQ